MSERTSVCSLGVLPEFGQGTYTKEQGCMHNRMRVRVEGNNRPAYRITIGEHNTNISDSLYKGYSSMITGRVWSL